MGKVKQAIQEVQEIVYWYVQGNKDISLPDVQTLLFKKHLMKDKANPYLVDDEVIPTLFIIIIVLIVNFNFIFL